MAYQVGDTIEAKLGFGGGQVSLRVRATVDAVDADGVPTARTPVEFAYVDERAVRTVTLRGGDFGELTDQYRSADRGTLTWHTITNPMRRFFEHPYRASFEGG